MSLQIACYKICTVKVNRAVRDRTKQVAANAATMQEQRPSPKCATCGCCSVGGV